MNTATYTRFLDVAAGVALVAAVLALWRRSLSAIVRILAVQGAAIATVALLIGLHYHEPSDVVVAALTFVLKAVLIPTVLLRIVRASPTQRETDPSVNVTASLAAAGVLAIAAFGVTRGIVRLAPSPETAAVPVGFAIVLIAYFGLVVRRNAIAQIVGFLLLENGIALVGLLAASGVSLVVELGAALDVLLAVLILQVLTTRMRTKYGELDLDQLQELHD